MTFHKVGSQVKNKNCVSHKRLFFTLFTLIVPAVTVIIDKIESWSDPEYVIVIFNTKGSISTSKCLVDNIFNFTRNITNLYVRHL